MVENKHISKIIISGIAVAVTLCFLAIIFSDDLVNALGGTGVTQQYESELFNTDEVIDINIIMSEEDWNTMLANATSELYYQCDVVVNGKTFKNVAIRPKGNTSLTSIASNPNTDRFSLKLEFDHYVKGQTCYGLDKLILNNNYADATNMKEAIIYDMFQYLGADASLYNYAKISVNGEYWGVYLALEGVEQSFMLRNYGTKDGDLYKPDSMEFGGDKSESGSSKDSSTPSFDSGSMPGFNGGSFEKMTPPSKDQGGSFSFNPGEQGGNGGFSMGGMGGFSMGNGGANLNYSDDNLSSYSTIWSGAITKSGDKDHERVVEALKNISQGNDIEKYMDVDNILKYMAVHTFSVNMDSLSGSMAHNYYLYECDGQLNIIPWDYNLSFGGMNGGDATAMVNDAIDTPFSSTNFFDCLLENEEYLAKYHEYLQKLVDEYVNGGRFDEVYSKIRSNIDSLVDTDPTAFFTYDEYVAGAQMLYKTIVLRAESISGQIAGTIPSTDNGQRNSTALVDASEINIKVMGDFNAGAGNSNGSTTGGKGAASENKEEPSASAGDKKDDNSSNNNESGKSGQVPTGDANFPSESGKGGMESQSGQQPPEGLQPPEGQQPQQRQENQNDQQGQGGKGEQGGISSQSGQTSDSGQGFPGGQSFPGGNNFNPGNFTDGNNTSGNSTVQKNLITYGICFGLVVIAALALTFIKRRRYGRVR